jgi:hypothetical protein
MPHHSHAEKSLAVARLELLLPLLFMTPPGKKGILCAENGHALLMGLLAENAMYEVYTMLGEN